MRGLALILALLAGQSAAAACNTLTFEEASYSVCEATIDQDLRLFLNGPNGPYGGFAAVDAELARNGETLAFAMNAGMFHPWVFISKTAYNSPV
jgi:uncharacterized protein YigE (DUF2233 family)